MTVSDSFNLYLMYCPDGDDSIWVSLSLIQWNWGGNAVNGVDGWTLTPGSANFPPANVTGSDCTTLPQWNNFFNNLAFR